MGGKHSDRRNFCDSAVSVFFPPAVAVAVRFSAGKIAGPSRALLELGVWTLGINVLMLLILSAFYGYEGTDISQVYPAFLGAFPAPCADLTVPAGRDRSENGRGKVADAIKPPLFCAGPTG